MRNPHQCYIDEDSSSNCPLAYSSSNNSLERSWDPYSFPIAWSGFKLQPRIIWMSSFNFFHHGGVHTRSIYFPYVCFPGYHLRVFFVVFGQTKASYVVDATTSTKAVSARPIQTTQTSPCQTLGVSPTTNLATIVGCVPGSSSGTRQPYAFRLRDSRKMPLACSGQRIHMVRTGKTWTFTWKEQSLGKVGVRTQW